VPPASPNVLPYAKDIANLWAVAGTLESPDSETWYMESGQGRRVSSGVLVIGATPVVGREDRRPIGQDG